MIKSTQHKEQYVASLGNWLSKAWGNYGPGNTISTLGRVAGLPDLGIGKALGGSGSLPGAIQGQNPSTYQGISSIPSDTHFVNSGTPKTTPQNIVDYLPHQFHVNDVPIPAGYNALGQAAPAGGGSSGTAPAYDPNTDPNAVNSMRANVAGLRGPLDALYNQLYSSILGQANQQQADVNKNYTQNANDLNTQYQNNSTDLNKQYQTGTDQTSANYAARGLADSSYRGNALQGLTDTYNTANQRATADYNEKNTNLTDARDNNLATVGKYVSDKLNGTDKNIGFNADKNATMSQFDLSKYNDVNSLNALADQLNQHIDMLKQQQAGLQTDPEYRTLLQQVAPQAAPKLADTGGTAAIQAKLQSLLASSAPPEAKNALAQGYLTQSNLTAADQGVWKNYWEKLLNGSQPQVA